MKTQAGAVAQQQALVLVFGLSYRVAARVAGIHHRNLWSHVAAKSGSNVAPWDSRAVEVKREAIEKCIENVIESVDSNAECLFTYNYDCAFVEINTTKAARVIDSALDMLKCKQVGIANRLIFEIPFVEE